MFLRGAIILAGIALAGGCSSEIGGDGDANLSPPDAIPAPCAPGPTGPHWLLEGESLVVDIACTSDLELGGDAFEISTLPAGASYDPQTARLSWTPGLDQAALYELTIAVPDYADAATLIIGVVDRWDHPDNVPVVNPRNYRFEYGLPVFFMAPAPTSADNYAPTTVYYRGRKYDAEAKLRGGSSLSYPKNSYTVEFESSELFTEPDRAGGFLAKKKITLTQTFDDNSYVRTRLAFDLWNAIAPGPITVQTYSAVLFLDGEYHGLYTVTDHIDGFLMEDVGLLRSGNLYKAINHDANFYLTDAYGNPKDTLHDGYEKKEGLPEAGQPGAFADLEALVNYVATASDGDFATTIATTIDIDSYIAWWLLVTFALADDTAGKNSYHYHDDSSLWYAVPWDFNHAFGQSWQTYRLPSDDMNLYRNRNNIFNRLLDTAPYATQMSSRYAAELTGDLSVAAAHALVDAYAAEIDLSARRDEGKWSATYRSFSSWSDRSDFTTYEQEIAYIRAWLTQRHLMLDSNY